MKAVLVSGIVILVLFIVTLQFIPLGIEPLTELYFENHTKLPVHIFPNQDYNFSFTVRNLEYQKMKYGYGVFFEDGEIIDSGEFILEDNSSKTIFEEFKIKRNSGRQKIIVNIVKNHSLEHPDFKDKLWWPDPNYPNEIDIHLWVEEIEGIKVTKV